jgi:tripartite-type tricarboxylate transporter receptor subunit TctC
VQYGWNEAGDAQCGLEDLHRRRVNRKQWLARHAEEEPRERPREDDVEGIARLAGASVLGAWAATFAFAPAAAQNYPTKPVRVIVGFAAGGPTDVIARLLAKDMSIAFDQSVIVENRTGANALLATETVARAEADGYILLFASQAHNVNRVTSKEAKYHPVKDFAPVTLAATLPLLLVTHPGAPFNSVQELVALAKAKPDTITYGSAGNFGSAHLATAMLERQASVKMTHIPFRGNAPALAEVIAGRVSFMFYPMIGIADQVAQKQLKVIAVGTVKRHPDYPDVPTMAEQGIANFEETAPWVGMLAPAGTPDTIVKKLNDAARNSLTKAETVERLNTLGAVVVGDTPQEFRTYLEKDIERWERVIAASGLKVE